MDKQALKEMKNFFEAWRHFFQAPKKAEPMARIVVDYHYVATIDMNRTYPTRDGLKDYFRNVSGKISEVTRDELLALLPVINCSADEVSLDRNIARCLMKQGPAYGWLFNPVLRVLELPHRKGTGVSYCNQGALKNSKIFAGTLSTYGAEVALLRVQKGMYGAAHFTQQWKQALKMKVVGSVRRSGISIDMNVADASIQRVPVVRCARGLHVPEPYDFVIRQGVPQLVWGHAGFEVFEDFRCNKSYLANQLVPRCGEAELLPALSQGKQRQDRHMKLTPRSFPPYHLRHPQI